MNSPLPKVNAVVDPAPPGWIVRCWDYDEPSITKSYTITASSDNHAARLGIDLFLADHEGLLAEWRSRQISAFPG